MKFKIKTINKWPPKNNSLSTQSALVWVTDHAVLCTNILLIYLLNHISILSLKFTQNVPLNKVITVA